MNDKQAKEIAKELRLIRIEFQKITNPPEVEQAPTPMTYDEMLEKQQRAGERVTIK